MQPFCNSLTQRSGGNDSARTRSPAQARAATTAVRHSSSGSTARPPRPPGVGVPTAQAVLPLGVISQPLCRTSGRGWRSSVRPAAATGSSRPRTTKAVPTSS